MQRVTEEGYGSHEGRAWPPREKGLRDKVEDSVSDALPPLRTKPGLVTRSLLGGRPLSPTPATSPVAGAAAPRHNSEVSQFQNHTQ